MATWKPGQSGNPSGRPKSALGIARAIRKQTGDGAELVAFYLEVFRDEDEPVILRMKAAEWLADRGWGKAMQSIDVAVQAMPIDASAVMARLSTEALRELAEAAEQDAGIIDIPDQADHPGTPPALPPAPAGPPAALPPPGPASGPPGAPAPAAAPQGPPAAGPASGPPGGPADPE